MPARVCTSCELKYPLSVEECVACGEVMRQSLTDNPPADWRARSEKRKKELVEAAEASVSERGDSRTIINRAKRIHALGVSWETAIDLAGRRGETGGYEVDVHDFEDALARLVARGCPPETAARILA